MRKILVGAGLMVERLTQKRWFVFFTATLVALVPAMYLYDQANRTTDEMHGLAESVSERLFSPSTVAPERLPSSIPTSPLSSSNTALGLDEVVSRWNKLSPELQHAIVTIVRQADLKEGTASSSVAELPPDDSSKTP